MTRTFCLMMAAALFAAGCGDDKTPDSNGGDGNGGGKGGSRRPTKPLPKNMPADIPIYPGARAIYVGTSEGGIRESPATSIQLETTTDSVEKVREFYEKTMKEHSWTMNVPGALYGKKGKRYIQVNVAKMPKSPGTVVIGVIFSRPDD